MKPKKDNSPHFDNYEIKIPKEVINDLVKKELNKLYPNHIELERMERNIFKLQIKVRDLENFVRSLRSGKVE